MIRVGMIGRCTMAASHVHMLAPLRDRIQRMITTLPLGFN